MIDMYGSEVGVGDTIITWLTEGKGCILKHVKVTKVNPNIVEFEYAYTPSNNHYELGKKSSVKTAKRKSNQIILLPPF